ncbi:two-component system regulatory protein YycI [Sporolactobacillus terrae]|uniref:two-component system regulatory protein YycI n=1 Tax=Sporolactobacillus terrae TaxID=269673 RepID=UPI000490642B|nr:two-component system regulatory protein YycI [Sporolactobacillus terrae]
MNWSRTKSIFIICFLLLDVFLVFEMYMRQQDENFVNYHDESQRYNYKLETVIPTMPQDITFLRGTRMDWSRNKDQLVQVAAKGKVREKQGFALDQNNLQLVSTFKRPISIGHIDSEDVQQDLLGNVYQGQEYKYWPFTSSSTEIKFAQTYRGRPVYISTRNKLQMLDFTIEDNKVTGFKQSYFSLTEKNKVDPINAEQAINSLAERTDLVGYNRLHIKAIELCYLNTVGDESSEPLIFVPAWHFVVHTVNGTSDYFVNAVSRNVLTIK